MGTENAGQFPFGSHGSIKGAGNVEPRRAFDSHILCLVAAVDTFFKEPRIERGALGELGEPRPGEDPGLHDGFTLFPAGEVRSGGLDSSQFLSGFVLVLGVALAKPLGKAGDG